MCLTCGITRAELSGYVLQWLSWWKCFPSLKGHFRRKKGLSTTYFTHFITIKRFEYYIVNVTYTRSPRELLFKNLSQNCYRNKTHKCVSGNLHHKTFLSQFEVIELKHYKKWMSYILQKISKQILTGMMLKHKTHLVWVF